MIRAAHSFRSPVIFVLFNQLEQYSNTREVGLRIESLVSQSVMTIGSAWLGQSAKL